MYVMILGMKKSLEMEGVDLASPVDSLHAQLPIRALRLLSDYKHRAPTNNTYTQ